MSTGSNTRQPRSYPTPTTAEVEAVASQLSLLDPQREGLDVTKLRAFYPKVSYAHLENRLAALEASGRVKRSYRANAGGVLIEYWTLV